MTGEQKKNDELFTEMLPKLKDWDGNGNAGNDAIFAMSLIRVPGDAGLQCKLEGIVAGDFDSIITLLTHAALKNPEVAEIICRAADSIVTQLESPANQIANAIKAAFPGARVEFMGSADITNLDVVCNCPSCQEKRKANKTNPNVN